MLIAPHIVFGPEPFLVIVAFRRQRALHARSHLVLVADGLELDVLLLHMCILRLRTIRPRQTDALIIDHLYHSTVLLAVLLVSSIAIIEQFLILVLILHEIGELK